jgi:hypothetical protein
MSSSSIGAPWITSQQRVQRAESNPMDKCTIVSILPKEINETKHTLQPGKFHLDKGSYEKPALLVIGNSSWWKVLDLNQPILEIPVSSMLIANSIITDYCNGILGCDMGDAMPGLFFVPGEKSIDQIRKEHQVKLDTARAKQRNWYTILIKVADTLWARSNGNPLAISDDARLAAQELQIKDKPWMKDFTTLELVNCPACGTLRNNSFPICQHCKVVIDKVKFEALGLKFAS